MPPSAGKVYQWEDPDPKLFDSRGSQAPEAAGPEAASSLAPGDVYKELRLCGYDYGPQFQGIHEASFEGGRTAPRFVLEGKSRGLTGPSPASWPGGGAPWVA